MSELIKKLVVPISVILALIGVVLAWSRGSAHAQLLDEARNLSVQVNQMQFRQTVYQRLAQELLVYSQRQPAIDPVLVAFGLKPAPPQPAQQPAASQPARPTTPSTPAPRSR
ncbi:MAG: hypothetical protein HZC54_02135 [Verrucomicrobia bacterium]|nr:hypothetical protein [Verrucomicrobiota bacterium]